MKKTFLYIALAMLFVTACEENYLRFESPQPESGSPLAAFPKKLQGKYVACDNSNKQLIIQDQHIHSIVRYPIRFLRDSIELDSSSTVDVYDNEALLATLQKEGMQATIKGDTVFSEMMSRDTLFSISPTTVLKKLKGHYFINQQKANSYWKVRRLSPQGDSLFLATITATDSLLSSHTITVATTVDTVSTLTEYEVATPNKKELKKWLKAQSTAESTCYCRKGDE